MSARPTCIPLIATLLVLLAAACCAAVECPFPTFEIIHSQQSARHAKLIAADLNDDGLDDLAALRGSEATADIYINTGGAFKLAQSLEFPGQPETLAVGDWNGDGHQDVFLATFSPAAIQLSLNDGTGAFTHAEVIDVNRNINTIVMHDVDGDGADDMLLTLFQDTEPNRVLRFHIGDDGDVRIDEITTERHYPFWISLGDADGDGDIDLVVSYTLTDDVQVLRNEGNGTFAAGPMVEVDHILPRIRVADLNGDDAADLIVEGSFAEPAQWYRNGGMGGFELAGTFADDGPSNFDFREIAVASMGAFSAPLVIGVNRAVHLFEAAQPGETIKAMAISPRAPHLRSLHFAIGEFDDAGGLDIVTSRAVFSEYNLFLYANRGVNLDCNSNGIADGCDIVSGVVNDCNNDGMNDACAIAAGISIDCDANGVPDDCQTDCNANGVLDACDIAEGTSTDHDDNGIPDECTFRDCNGDGVNDLVQTATGIVDDCNGNFIPDPCELDNNGWGYDDGTSDGITFFQPGGAAMTAVRFDAGDGVLITAITAATINTTVEAGFPIHLFVWDDPNGDGQPDDAVLLAQRVAPIQVMNYEGDNDAPVFNRWPIDPVFVSGTFFVGFGVEPDDFNGYSILLPDFDSYQHERRTWFAKGLGTSALAAAQPEGNRLLAPLLRVETTDCNDNAVPDACDLNDGTLHDADGDLVPDECPCPRDMTGDHFIDGLDVAQLISSWGPCNGCRADINRSSSVDVVDLLLLLQDWGPCP